MADPTSQTNYGHIATEHIALDWAINFSEKVISGSVVHTLRVKENGVKEALYVP